MLHVVTLLSPGAFGPVTDGAPDDFYLMVGELVRYKRPDLAVETFNGSGKQLVVIGGGEMLGELRRNAGPNVEILGSQPFETIRSHYRRCRALIFPGEEDFGIVPVEAMAAGRPVIAFGRGGVTETVVDGVTGILFDNQTSTDLVRHRAVRGDKFRATNDCRPCARVRHVSVQIANASVGRCRSKRATRP